ncbi:MAG: hypothetical protein OIF48_06785 [Silicimonas sp.]|nr:hypothetical protein [Silicimonas sp.]
MAERPRPISRIIALQQQDDVFKHGLVRIPLLLAPLRRVSAQGDMIFAGFIEDKRIEFACIGKTRQETDPLMAALDNLVKSENATARSRGLPAPHPINLRLQVRADGSWRTRLTETETEGLKKMYQFVAARWTFKDANGRPRTDGALPKT